MSTFYSPSDSNPGLRSTVQQRRQNRKRKIAVADMGSRLTLQLISSTLGIYKDDSGYHFKSINLKAAPLHNKDSDAIKEQLIFKSHNAFLSLQYNLDFIGAIIQLSKTLAKQNELTECLSSKAKIDAIKSIGFERTEEKLKSWSARRFDANLDALCGNVQHSANEPLARPLSKGLVKVLNNSIKAITDIQSTCEEMDIKLPNLEAGQKKLISQAHLFIENIEEYSQDINNFSSFVEEEINAKYTNIKGL